MKFKRRIKTVLRRLPALLALCTVTSIAVAGQSYSFRVHVPGLTAVQAPPSGCSGKQVFAYTGADQSFTLPSGCSQATFKAWAGGGGGAYLLNGTGGSGGGGAYVQVTYAAPAGTAFTLRVGGGGYNGGNTLHAAYPSGGQNTNSAGSGGGGGSWCFFAPAEPYDAYMAGGGGSSFAASTGTNPVLQSASGGSPANTSSPDYQAGVGAGGTSNSSNGTNGGNGLIVVTYQ
jgi:hypothetical protein